MSSAASASRTLTQRYVLALALIAATSVTAYGVLSTLIEEQRDSALAINVSGRQRMLSQRTALFAVRVATATTAAAREAHRAKLRALTGVLGRANEGLVHGDPSVGLPGDPPPHLRALYFGPTDLYARVERYAHTLRTIADSPSPSLEDPSVANVLADSPRLLADLNRAVSAYEDHANERTDFLHRTEGFLVAFTLLLLFAEAHLIFRPLVGQVRASLERIEAQSEILREREQSMRLVLNSTGDGLVLLNGDGSLGKIRSTVVRGWFGEGLPVWAGLFPEDPVKREEFALAFDLIADDAMPFEVIVDQMPKRMNRRGRTYDLELRRIERSNDAHLLLIIRDVTAELAHEQAARDAKELVKIIELYTRDRGGFVEFLGEMDRRLTQLQIDGRPRHEQLRTLHTLKGSAAIFHFMDFATRCHALESELESEQIVAAQSYVELDDQWRRALGRIEAFIVDTGASDVLDVTRQDYDELVEWVRVHYANADLLCMLRQWRHMPARRRLDRLRQHAVRLGEALGKRIEVTVDDRQLRIPPGYLEDFWPSLVHVVRNAVDHGLELPAEREAAGKPPEGHISVSASLGTEFTVRIEDDGRGIDWARVREKAAQRGLEVHSESDLVDALFEAGLSTRDEVTELSGRGIGMSDVLAQCEHHSGRVEVQSRPGRGAAFVFHFPAPTTAFTQDLAGPRV